MKIIVASDSFKGSCSTLEVAQAVEKGIRKIYQDANVIKIPVADGGEGTVEALVLGTGGNYFEAEVVGPLGEKVIAKYGVLENNIAVIEMAAASGLTLVDKKALNPMIATTYGTGQLLQAAMDKGCKRIFVGIGGSATNDAGVGMAQALGVSFKTVDGKEIGFGGGELAKIAEIDITNVDPRLSKTEIIIMSDVTNTLCGPGGASLVYGPQKGASPEMAKQLDANLSHYAAVIKEKLGKDIIDVPGTGAAGGIGASLLTFCNSIITPGIDKVLDIADIDRHLMDADLVITGEGQIDHQSVYGKVPVGVAKWAIKHKVPVLAIVGSVGEGASAVYSHGVDVIMDIVNRPMTLNEAIENAPALIEQAAENAMRLIKIAAPKRL